MDIIIGEDEQQWLDEVLSGAPSAAPWHGGPNQELKQGNGFPVEAGSFPAEERAFEGDGALMAPMGGAESGELDIWAGLTVAAARPAELDLPDLDLNAIVSLEPQPESLRTADAPAAAAAAAAAADSSADEAATSGSGYPPPPHSPPEACTAESSGLDAPATQERVPKGFARPPSPAQQQEAQQQPIQPPVSPSPSASNSTGFGASDSAAPETSSRSGGSSAQSSKTTQSREQSQQQRQQEEEEGERSGQEGVPPPGMDPKAYARQMRNRESAAQSRVRKKKYMEEMEQKMQHLEAANAQLNGMVQQLSAENAALKCQLANAYSGQKAPGGYAVPISYPGAYPHPYMVPAAAPVPAPKLPIPAPKRKGSSDAGSKGKKAKSVPKAAAAASAALLSVVCCLAFVAGPWTALGGPQAMPLSASSHGSSSELARSGRVLAAIGMGRDATAAAAALLPSDFEDGTTGSRSRRSSGGGIRERRREALAALPSGVEEANSKGTGGELGREEQQDDERKNDRRLTLPQLGPITEDYQNQQPSRRSRRASKGAIDRKGGFREAEAGALVPEGIAVYQDAAPAPEASSTVAKWSEYPDVTVLQSAAADLNVIESLWDVLDAKLDAGECHCISHQLKAEVKRVWLSITIDTCRRLVEPMPSRAPRVIQHQSGHIERA